MQGDETAGLRQRRWFGTKGVSLPASKGKLVRGREFTIAKE